jgi:hypothetical protein
MFHFGTHFVTSTWSPRRKPKPLPNVIFAVGDRIARVAEDDEAVWTVGAYPNTEGSITRRMSGAWTNNAIAPRYVAAKRARSRTHIGCVHVKNPSGNLLVDQSGRVCHWPK